LFWAKGSLVVTCLADPFGYLRYEIIWSLADGFMYGRIYEFCLQLVANYFATSGSKGYCICFDNVVFISVSLTFFIG